MNVTFRLISLLGLCLGSRAAAAVVTHRRIALLRQVKHECLDRALAGVPGEQKNAWGWLKPWAKSRPLIEIFN